MKLTHYSLAALLALSAPLSLVKADSVIPSQNDRNSEAYGKKHHKHHHKHHKDKDKKKHEKKHKKHHHKDKDGDDKSAGETKKSES